MWSKNNKYGFTLIELLVVIAIIGILSTVAVVNLRYAKDKARKANIYTLLRQMQEPIQICLFDEKPLLCYNDFGAQGLCSGKDNNKPLADRPICEGSENKWPDLKYEEYNWYRANSNVRELTFGIEIQHNNPLYSIPSYISCTEKGCFQENWSSQISTDCAILHENCGEFFYNCCHDTDAEGHPLQCIDGTCHYNTGVIPELPI